MVSGSFYPLPHRAFPNRAPILFHTSGLETRWPCLCKNDHFLPIRTGYCVMCCWPCLRLTTGPGEPDAQYHPNGCPARHEGYRTQRSSKSLATNPAYDRAMKQFTDQSGIDAKRIKMIMPFDVEAKNLMAILSMCRFQRPQGYDG